jgi:hypothetical protein
MGAPPSLDVAARSVGHLEIAGRLADEAMPGWLFLPKACASPAEAAIVSGR